MRLARSSGARVLALTNVMGSQATRDSDGVLFTRAGPEVSVAATKTYTNQLLLLAMLVLLPSAAATPLSPGEDSTEPELTISSITPVVDGESTGLVEGELTNTTDVTLIAPEVSLVGRAASADRGASAMTFDRYDFATSARPAFCAETPKRSSATVDSGCSFR